MLVESSRLAIDDDNLSPLEEVLELPQDFRPRAFWTSLLVMMEASILTMIWQTDVTFPKGPLLRIRRYILLCIFTI